MIIQFTVMGTPKGKARPRFVRTCKGVRTYTPKQTETYQNEVAVAYMQSCKGAKLNGPIWANITAYYAMPKSTPKSKRSDMVWYDKKPDVDNIAKAVMDALNGIAYDDDKQITSLIIDKRYGAPHIEVTMGEFNDGNNSAGGN